MNYTKKEQQEIKKLEKSLKRKSSKITDDGLGVALRIYFENIKEHEKDYVSDYIVFGDIDNCFYLNRNTVNQNNN
ncbi:MAG: hypothetical protein GY849_02665 [Deltaproteobacteria bacterium]|nr:hypothetical protein [Deltaproteobacteria bacterium]